MGRVSDIGWRTLGAALLAGAIAGAAPSPATATVRFGHNVFIGGHDFSNQTYGRNRRAEIHLSDRTPRNEGCVWRREGRGRVKLCQLRRIRSR